MQQENNDKRLEDGESRGDTGQPQELRCKNGCSLQPSLLSVHESLVHTLATCSDRHEFQQKILEVVTNLKVCLFLMGRERGQQTFQSLLTLNSCISREVFSPHLAIAFVVNTLSRQAST